MTGLSRLGRAKYKTAARKGLPRLGRAIKRKTAARKGRPNISPVGANAAKSTVYVRHSTSRHCKKSMMMVFCT